MHLHSHFGCAYYVIFNMFDAHVHHLSFCSEIIHRTRQVRPISPWCTTFLESPYNAGPIRKVLRAAETTRTRQRKPERARVPKKLTGIAGGAGLLAKCEGELPRERGGGQG